MTNLPLAVTRDGGGTASFTIDFVPDAARRPERAVLVLGQDEYPAARRSARRRRSLTFVIPDAPVGSLLARLRVDGIESPIIDLSQEPPAVADVPEPAGGDRVNAPQNAGAAGTGPTRTSACWSPSSRG